MKVSTRMNIFIFIIIHTADDTLCVSDTICSRCSDRQANSAVYERCRKDNQTSRDLILSNSCCINKTLSNGGIIGLDLSSCYLKNLTGMLNYFHELQTLMLENNTELQVVDKDFRGLSKLKYLSLPKNITCPGGNESWGTTKADPAKNLCLDEINLCKTRNVSCPNSNSHCVLMAPGTMECLCNQGYHGYKCLRQGIFPYSGYFIVLCVCTVVIAGFLWCTQRRHVKVIHKD